MMKYLECERCGNFLCGFCTTVSPCFSDPNLITPSQFQPRPTYKSHSTTTGSNMKPPKTTSFLPRIKNVIFNDPATIVLWEDNTKTVVKAQGEDVFDPEKGLAMAIVKRALGNKGHYCEIFKQWIPKEEDIVFLKPKTGKRSSISLSELNQ